MVYCRRLSLWTVVRCFCLSLLAVVIYMGSKSHSIHWKSRHIDTIAKKTDSLVYMKEDLPEPQEVDDSQFENIEIIEVPQTPAPILSSKIIETTKPKVASHGLNKVGSPKVPPKIIKSGGVKLQEKVDLKIKKSPTKLRPVLSAGENFQVDNLDVYINTAVHYERYPSNNSFNVMLNGWANIRSPMDFKCCFTYREEGREFVEAQAHVYNVYKQYVVEMQSAEFYCTLQDNQRAADLSFVTLVKQSCKAASDKNKLISIEKPKLYPGVIGVCLKVAYGALNAEKIVEWFEYMRYMGIPKVFTYYSQVEAPGMSVLNYYKSIGLLDMLPIYPAKSKNGKDRNFIKPYNFKQYWVDNVVAINGCKHRMSGFDYVMTLSIDQFIFPKGKVQSFPDIIQELMKREPKGGAFRFDQHIAVMNWNASRKSPLHVSKYLIRTKSLNYGNNLTATPGWIFVPRRTLYVGKDRVYPLPNFKLEKVPHELYTMLQYRVCDKYWPGCQKETKIAEHGMLKYEVKLVDRILKLPLKQILSSNLNYVNYMISWRRKHQV